jgi:hypothetical protein
VDSLDLDKSIINVLGRNASVNWRHFVIIGHHPKTNIRQEFKVKKQVPDTLHYAEIKLNQKVYYMILDEAPGKTESFIYAIYLNEDLSIKDVDVLVYRELYGGEIDDISFRRQFSGIQEPERIIYGRSIHGVTGATISSRSITYHVRDILLIYKTIMRNGEFID